MKKAFYLLLASLVLVAAPAYAQADALSEYGPLGLGLMFGLAVMGGALAQGKAISSGLDSIGRNPSASGTIMVQMLIGLAFVESLVILGFVIAFLKF